MAKTYHEVYQEKLEQSRKEHPFLKERYCPNCGQELVKNSINYWEGYHADGCY